MDDGDLLTELWSMKLSVDMKLYTDTQKSASVNRSLRVSLPQNGTFSRNIIIKGFSSMYRYNNGPGTSAIEKCQNSGVEL